jgi:hypothetical protein
MGKEGFQGAEDAKHEKVTNWRVLMEREAKNSREY